MRRTILRPQLTQYFSVLALQRKDKAREVFKRILDQEEQFFISKTAVFYDLQSLFYSMNALQMDHVSGLM